MDADEIRRENAPPLKSGPSVEIGWKSALGVFGISKRGIEAYQRNVDEVMDAARRDRE